MGTGVAEYPPVARRPARRQWPTFLAAGGILFVVKGAVFPVAHDLPADTAIVVDAGTLVSLRQEYQRRNGRQPDDAEEAGLVRHFVDDEILYREALSLGIDRSNFAVKRRLARSMGFLSEMTEDDSHEERTSGVGDADATAAAAGSQDDHLYRRALELGIDKSDPVLRRLLIENMRLAMRYSGLDPAPPDEDLQRYMNEHQDEFMAPALLSFEQVWFGRTARGRSLSRDATAARERLLSGDEAGGRRLGDAFAGGSVFRRQSPRALARVFEPAFVERLLQLETGTWSEPLESMRGLHLVRVIAKDAARPLRLDEARSQVLARWRAARGEERLKRTLEELRQQYTVQIVRGEEMPAAIPSATGPAGPA